jgi:hypothetical protein
LELFRNLTAGQVRERLVALDAEAKALRVLLRGVTARDREIARRQSQPKLLGIG